MITKTITEANLRGLAADLLQAGVRVAGPVRPPNANVSIYAWLPKVEALALDASLPRRSLKEFFFPPTEEILRWKQKGSDVELEEVPTRFAPQVILGARPCDAAGVEILDKVMGWDFRDELWFGRREATTIVSIACPGIDASCFCTAVGLAPDSTKGSDVLLIPVEGGYRAEAVTAKGEALVNAHPGRFSEAGESSAAEAYRTAARAKVRANLSVDAAGLGGWLEKNFEHGYWQGLALRCHGCGACACVCPTCHCFDLVDEPSGVGQGARRRNWDTCQAGKFTLHASGHNPRGSQTERFRQRVMHKFSIYPKRFGDLLCTGCGRCARACPAGMDLPQVLGEIAKLAAQ